MTQLTPHFSLEELTITSKPFDNTPPPAKLEILHLVLAPKLEVVRHLLGDHPIHVNSAFRSPQVNAAVGGVATSAHLSAYAADIVCPDFGTPYQIALKLAAAMHAGIIRPDQIIQERGVWCHVSFAPDPRLELLTLTTSGQYVAGIQPPAET